MNRKDEEIRDEWNSRNSSYLEKACMYLEKYEQNVQDYLADVVASLCNVVKDEMFEATDVVYLAHARWLYWYAYRYMTNESYDKIAQQSFHKKHTFAQRTIQNGANKMAMMIEKEALWKKRWIILKRIIKLKDEKNNESVDNTIVIQVPKGMRDNINIVIKDK